MPDTPLSSWMLSGKPEKRLIKYGRREDDCGKCALHDFVWDKNEGCIEFLKSKLDHSEKTFDTKFEKLEAKLGQYVTRWALTTILSICIPVVGAMFGFGLWQINSISQALQNQLAVTLAVNQEIVDIRVGQKRINEFIQTLEPEHRKLMKFLEDHQIDNH